MKRNLMSTLSAFMLLVAVMTSCSKKSSEYIHAIPADAQVVAAVNLQDLIRKSGVSGEDKQKVIDMLQGEMSATTFEHVEKILKDGSESGVSVKDPIYLAITEQKGSVVVMKVSSLDKLKKTFEVMGSEQIINGIIETNGYHVAQLPSNSACVFNESTLIIGEGGNAEGMATRLIKQTEEEGIANNFYFKSMREKKGDISFFFTLDALPGVYKRQVELGIGNISGLEPKDVGVAGALNFENGKVSLTGQTVSENEQVKELIEKQKGTTGKIKNTFLANFPVSTLMYMALNIDGEKMYRAMEENEELRKAFAGQGMEQLKDIIMAIKGDVSGGLIDITMNDIPAFTAYAEAKNGAALNALYEAKDQLKLGRRDDIVKLGEDEYVYKTRDMNIFFGYKKGYLYLTSNELLQKNIGKKEDKSLKGAAYASHMNGKHAYFVINVQAILNLPVVKMASAMGGREAAMYIDVASNIDYLEVTGDSDNQSEFSLYLKDKDTNALKQIIDLTKKYAGL